MPQPLFLSSLPEWKFLLPIISAFYDTVHTPGLSRRSVTIDRKRISHRHDHLLLREYETAESENQPPQHELRMNTLFFNLYCNLTISNGKWSDPSISNLGKPSSSVNYQCHCGIVECNDTTSGRIRSAGLHSGTKHGGEGGRYVLSVKNYSYSWGQLLCPSFSTC